MLNSSFAYGNGGIFGPQDAQGNAPFMWQGQMYHMPMVHEGQAMTPERAQTLIQQGLFRPQQGAQVPGQANPLTGSEMGSAMAPAMAPAMGSPTLTTPPPTPPLPPVMRPPSTITPPAVEPEPFDLPGDWDIMDEVAKGRYRAKMQIAKAGLPMGQQPNLGRYGPGAQNFINPVTGQGEMRFAPSWQFEMK